VLQTSTRHSNSARRVPPSLQIVTIAVDFMREADGNGSSFFEYADTLIGLHNLATKKAGLQSSFGVGFGTLQKPSTLFATTCLLFQQFSRTAAGELGGCVGLSTSSGHGLETRSSFSASVRNTADPNGTGDGTGTQSSIELSHNALLPIDLHDRLGTSRAAIHIHQTSAHTPVLVIRTAPLNVISAEQFHSLMISFTWLQNRTSYS
jgi:hypothetical protein